jgi:hypothetical protein
MWSATFESRLAEWNRLRQYTSTLDEYDRLLAINNWWFSAPWRPYHLHWDDQATWPDPWQLLSDNVYCDLARALGIVYTILIIDSSMSERITLAGTCNGNLVLIDGEKYILNWHPGELLNNQSTNVQITRQLSGKQLYQAIGE